MRVEEGKARSTSAVAAAALSSAARRARETCRSDEAHCFASLSALRCARCALSATRFAVTTSLSRRRRCCASAVIMASFTFSSVLSNVEDASSSAPLRPPLLSMWRAWTMEEPIRRKENRPPLRWTRLTAPLLWAVHCLPPQPSSHAQPQCPPVQWHAPCSPQPPRHRTAPVLTPHVAPTKPCSQ